MVGPPAKKNQCFDRVQAPVEPLRVKHIVQLKLTLLLF